MPAAAVLALPGMFPASNTSVVSPRERSCHAIAQPISPPPMTAISGPRSPTSVKITGMHRFLLHNGQILDTSAKSVSAGQVGFLNGWGVFSTIRVSKGVLFAWERHWQRMQRDSTRMRVPFPHDPDELRNSLLELVEANDAPEATLRVAVIRNRGGLFEGAGINRDFEVVAFTAPLTEWGSSVRLAIKPDARHAACEFSGTKFTSWAMNLAWYEEAHERGFDEYVLLNERGEVAECTSANIFTVFGQEAVTPPLSSGCLAGVTRELLLNAIHTEGIRASERVLVPEDLERADEVFISSTTRDVLPVEAIEGLQVHGEAKAARALQSAFARYRDEYCSNQREARPLAAKAESRLV